VKQEMKVHVEMSAVLVQTEKMVHLDSQKRVMQVFLEHVD